MIIINGYKFAEKEVEIIDSLFEKNGTVSGRTKRFKRKIMFYDIQGNPFGVIAQSGVVGSATKLDNGKIWYGYGTPYFIPDVDNTIAYERELAKSLSVDSDSKGWIFK